MKKVFFAAACVLLLLSLTACGESGNPNASKQGSTAPVSTAPVSPELSTPEASAVATPSSQLSTPGPVLKVTDENGTDLGTVIEIPVGADNGKFIKFFTDNLGALNPRIGWDDSLLTAAGITIVPQFEPELKLYISAEKETSANLRLYLSATDDWSDADNPPVELIVTIKAK